MAEVRCPKHDIIFSTVTDHRKPGSPKSDKQPAMPVDCHPDCPMVEQKKTEQKKLAFGEPAASKPAERW